ncbi:insulin-like growth factor-binding protein 3 [Myotis myotis]|uniref:Insulin-like growth factor-binding protein 3 n=1 Tax=Myotis myotis TaxID=51298 RepID=A0A7J7V388_MYOMY|nr:insulin-like growth factor-binding protein 3 [Myotis myotis]XP_036183089.1 insulin-like growth factor-binding protein 3 [Myotis myotis]KAF6319599.1 insulin like growth factor binding protein 3 [Myotis myotis]
MQPPRPVLLAAALAALGLLLGLPAAQAGAGAAGAGPVVSCEPCDARAQAQCAPPPAGCAELVREPGCGCCLTCALREGQPCGVYSERCGSGLRCQPPPGEARPLQALLEGRGFCANANAAGRPHPQAPPAPGDGSESEEELSAVTAGSPALTHWAPDSRFHLGHTKMDAIRRGSAKDSQRHRVHLEAQGAVTQNFSSESRQDTEHGPCRREMEDMLNRLKSLSTLSPRGIQLPNCDKKGFYKKKQCRPAKGRKRGLCWCVDKYGQPLPGHDPPGKPDVHCDSVESQ